jgi:hypothetical protein
MFLLSSMPFSWATPTKEYPMPRLTLNLPWMELTLGLLALALLAR